MSVQRDPEPRHAVEVRGDDIEDLDIETQEAIERAEARAARGEGIPADEAFERLRRKHFDRCRG